MNKQPLTISGLGMVSPLAIGVNLNAIAMQLKYDAFQESSFMQPHNCEKQIAATIEFEDDEKKYIRGSDKLIYIAGMAMEEAISKLIPNSTELTFLLCLPDQQSPRSHNDEIYAQSLFNTICKKYSQYNFSKHSRPIYKNRSSFVYALKLAQELLYKQDQQHVLILGIDSLVNSTSLTQYGGDIYGEDCRLLCDSNSNGFIPGEAATAVIVSNPSITQSRHSIRITGIGFGEEKSIIGSDDVNKGEGLRQAIHQAEKHAGTIMADIALRIASVSGEEYFFKEASLAQIKTMTKVRDDQPLWHPADSIGEVGSAIGPSMMVMAFQSLYKNYAPGNKIICHISDDDGCRAAFIVEKQ